MNSENRWFSILFLSVFSISIVIRWEAAKSSLILLLIILFSRICIEDWNRFTMIFCLSYYIVWGVLSVKSLILFPYGNEGRYYTGMWGSSAPAAMFSLGAVVASLLLLDRFLKTRSEMKRVYKALILFVLFSAVFLSVFFISLIGSRSGELASVACVFMYAVTYEGIDEPKENVKKRRRVLLTVLGCFISLVILGVFATLIFRVDFNHIAEDISNEFFKNKIIFIGNQIYSLNNRHSYGILPEGSIWNAIDRLSADRISIWVGHLRYMTWFGSDDIGQVNGNGTHSTYLWCLRKFGWIVGTVMCVVVVLAGIICLKRVLQKKQEYMFSFLWSTAFLVYSLTDQTLWQHSLGFMYIISLYPVLFEFKRKRVKV